jgi:hypothetical protein
VEVVGRALFIADGACFMVHIGFDSVYGWVNYRHSISD